MTRIATWLLAVSVGLTLAAGYRRFDEAMLARGLAVVAHVAER